MTDESRAQKCDLRLVLVVCSHHVGGGEGGIPGSCGPGPPRRPPHLDLHVQGRPWAFSSPASSISVPRGSAVNANVVIGFLSGFRLLLMFLEG